VASSSYHLAQINIGRALVPMDHPQFADFMAALAPINALADAHPGFVWRFQTDDGNATAVRPYDDDRMMINFSVWKDLESLRDFTYSGDHAAIMRRRREWFEKMADLYMALWWVPAGHIPSVEEAVAKLEHLRQFGPSPEVFTFRQFYPAPDTETETQTITPTTVADPCPAV
jgi:heme-degrading monooxygenase HmoA